MIPQKMKAAVIRQFGAPLQTEGVPVKAPHGLIGGCVVLEIIKP